MRNPDDDPILEGPGDDGDKYPDPDARCRNCAGQRHIQRCPEIWAALRAA